jgi:PAS domain S-box-containing protein
VQQLLDLIPAVIFEYTAFADGSRKFTYISPYCRELLGRTSEEVMGQQFRLKDLIHPDDWGDFKLVKDTQAQALSDMRWEGRIVLPDQTTKWVEMVATPTRVHQSLIWRGLMNDISLRKQLEQQQQDAETRYRDLLESMPLGVGIHRMGQLVYANRYAVELMGASSMEELISKPMEELIHPAYLPMVQDRIQRMMRGEEVPIVEEKLIRLDGKVIDVEMFSRRYIYRNEPAIQILVKDITQQKQAAASVRKVETLFLQLFENAPLAIVMLDGNGKVVRINRGFQNLFGFSIEELRGRGLNTFIVPRDLETQGNKIDSVISSYQVVQVETVRLHKDGRQISVILYGVPVRQEDETIAIFGVYVDITNIRSMEAELKTRNAELDNFVYKVSHDLRAPLTSVMGLVQLAALPGNTDNPHDYLKRIGAQVQQLDAFISDVLSHSKNLKMDVKIDEVNVEELVHKAFADLSYLAGANQVSYTVSHRGPALYSDPWRLSEVVRNLVSNAIKYRHEQRPTQVSVSIDCSPESCEIKFADTGMGIASDKLPHVFDMFYRASSKAQGSGLGLYIVKNAIERLKGSLQVESKLSEGTTFIIHLPNYTPATR